MGDGTGEKQVPPYACFAALRFGMAEICGGGETVGRCRKAGSSTPLASLRSGRDDRVS
jgi:hypothetical protein